ncbi:MAG: porin family protein [Prevotella sp.]|jgi:hypothetical protein
MKIKTIALLALFALASLSVKAQIGEHRNDLSIGVNGGYALSNIGFTPSVSQSMHGGFTGGISLRYVCEKYFSTICSIYTELNYTQMGWKEDIKDANDQPVINSTTNEAENYKRTLNYLQIPVFAHLAWGREKKGFQFFIQAGPQFGYLLSESTDSNFDFAQRNQDDRANKVCAQDTMSVEHKFDYGIAAGAGLEYTLPKIGHFLLEGRYYYGLGNIYGDSKRDYFSKSNHGSIVIKLTYLRDI